jgi:single-stranded DNA-binding protein
MTIEAALFGTLGRDAELKTSSKGRACLRANIAVNEGEATTWVSATIFDQAAIDNSARFVKGARLYVEGKLSFNEWTGNDGEKRVGLSVMSWHCRLSQIGRNKPKRKSSGTSAPVERQAQRPTLPATIFTPTKSRLLRSGGDEHGIGG